MTYVLDKKWTCKFETGIFKFITSLLNQSKASKEIKTKAYKFFQCLPWVGNRHDTGKTEIYKNSHYCSKSKKRKENVICVEELLVGTTCNKNKGNNPNENST